MHGDIPVKNTASQNSSSLGVTFLGGKVEGSNLTTPEKTEPPSPDLHKKEKVFNVSRAFEENTLDQGTIITDKRHAQPSFGDILVAAMHEWWGKNSSLFENSLKKIKAATKVEQPPTIEDPHERKDIIAEAAQFTAQAPRDDHRVIVEKIKTLSHDVERAVSNSYAIKEKSADSAPIIEQPKKTSHEKLVEKTPLSQLKPLDLRKSSIAPDVGKQSHTGEGAPFTRAPHFERVSPHVPESVVIPRMQPKPTGLPSQKSTFGIAPIISPHTTPSFTPPKPAIVPLPQTFKASPETIPPQAKEVPEQQLPELPVWTSSLTPKQEMPPTPTPITVHPQEKQVQQTPQPERVVPLRDLVQPSTQVHHERVAEQKTPTRETRPKPETRLTANTKATIPSPTLNFASIIIIVGVAALLGISTGVYVVSRSMLGGDAPATPEYVPEVLSFFSTPIANVSLPLPQTHAEMLQSIADKIPASKTGITQFSFTTNTKPATASEIMGVLQPQVDATFVRGLDDTLVIGTIHTEQTSPFIILKTKTFEVAFAGMLSWEQMMSADLAPLFGNPGKDTRAQSVGTSTRSSPHFVDAVEDNHSIRILYDENGSEKIIYAVINQNIIIITTSTKALSEIIRNMR